MIEYEEYQEYIEITFRGSGKVGAYTFMYWIDAELESEENGESRKEAEEASLKSLGYEVEFINESWWIYWK